jgi:SAM-dependent methyltransferase
MVESDRAMTDRAALDRLRDLFRLDPAAARERISPEFCDYHADLYRHGVPFEIYIEKACRIRCDLGRAERVLDLGAGFGVYACLLRILGIPRVTAFDYQNDKARGARRLIDFLELDGVTVVRGDGTTLPFRTGGPFDAAVALASLSHVRDPERALRETASAMKPGGRLYVFEDNNATYPPYWRQMARIWEGAETGRYPDDIPREKRLPEAYLNLRRRMIAGEFPGLSPEDADFCARSTRGLYGPLLSAAVREYRETGRLRNPRRHVVCHPATGEVLEYPFDPFLLSRMLRRAGFEPRLRSPVTGPFRGRRRAAKRLASRILAAFPVLLPWTSPIFAVVGTLKR